MKAPDIDDVCDPHVRAAYRKMLLLLDSNPLDVPRSANVNSRIAYLDPARDVRLGTPDFDDTNRQCRKLHDPPHHIGGMAVQKSAGATEMNTDGKAFPPNLIAFWPASIRSQGHSRKTTTLTSCWQF